MDVLSKKYNYIKISKFCDTMFYFILLFAFNLEIIKEKQEHDE